MLGSTHRVRYGNSPVCWCLQNAQIKSMKSSRGGAEATWHGCGCAPARSIQIECCCRFLRGHQVTPVSSTATGQLMPGSDLYEMRWGKSKPSVTPISASVNPFSLARKCRITCFGQAMLPTIQVHCFVKTAVSLFIVSAPIVVTFNRCSKLPVRSQFLFYYNITAQSKFQHVNYHVLQPIFAPAWRP